MQLRLQLPTGASRRPASSHLCRQSRPYRSDETHPSLRPAGKPKCEVLQLHVLHVKAELKLADAFLGLRSTALIPCDLTEQPKCPASKTEKADEKKEVVRGEAIGGCLLKTLFTECCKIHTLSHEITEASEYLFSPSILFHTQLWLCFEHTPIRLHINYSLIITMLALAMLG